MESPDLHAQLLVEATAYDPAEHHRALLAPYRDVVLLWRAKMMSYEDIAATLTRRGLKVSPAGVGCFCRRHFTKAEIVAKRRELGIGESAPVGPAGREGGRRGPRLAHNNY